ncbi:T9SS C-terminal target domain-containing protein [Lutibacter sp. HS1-25]|uniref:chondroitinase-B domain-containing protein n=1 Tax=Lutibacter sp. HS1-25 TaxID=2485000 RepID=UPI0010112BA9|nr:chondroitinase-B domain-containing protein [Lutibacter sp. HS1-25]RXP45218.1 T9SS C-terminal target domain-containing protein [Lutibacter sp. HS1-25]
MYKFTFIKTELNSVLFKPLKNYFALIFLFVLSFNSIAQTVTHVTSDNDLEDAVALAAPGDVIIVDNGTYNSFQVTISGIVSVGDPITIKAETIGGVTLTGSSHFRLKQSSNIVIEGFVMDCEGTSSLVKLDGCNNIRISRNVFELVTTSSIKWVYIGGVWDDTTEPYQYLSHDNRIDHNIFQNKTLPGHYITIDGTNSVVQSQNDRIDHNYFKNNGPRAVNEQESIRIGWSDMSMSSGFTTVEYNLFENCDGDPEILSVKSSDNIIRHNTFIKSYGTLSLRHGNRNRVEGNYFFGGEKEIGLSPDGATLYTGGIRVYGKDHVIINNYFEGLNGTKWDAPITITQGDALETSTSYSKHFIPQDIVIAYNTLVNNDYGIEIGFDNNGSYSKKVQNILFANNLVTGSTNSLVNYINNQGSEVIWKNNLMYPTGTATLTNDGSTFTVNEAITENPFLVMNDGVYRSTTNTPKYNDSSSGAASTDIEGQTRPALSNPGADHFSAESVRYAPLTANDVGPYVADDGTISENLTVTTVSEYDAAGGSQSVTVTSNIANWTVSETSDWISVSPSTGSENGSFDIIVSKNETFVERTALVNVAGGSESRNVSVTQAAADPKADLTLINNLGNGNDGVVVNYFSHEEVTSTKNNVAGNSLDKSFSTLWSGNGTEDPSGLAIIIFDLGAYYDLELVDFASTNGKTYEFQIWVSSTGTADVDFSNPFTADEKLLSNSDGSFKSFFLPSVASNVRFVKIVGYGQPKPSTWTSISEIEFYGNLVAALSVEEDEFASQLNIYPIPATGTLNIMAKNNNVKSVKLFGVDGRMLINKTISSMQFEIPLDVSSIANGTYLLVLTNDSNVTYSKLIYISK